MHPSVSVIIFILVLTQLIWLGQLFQMSISYCEGPKLVRLTADECPAGINFGISKPSCVCINGV